MRKAILDLTLPVWEHTKAVRKVVWDRAIANSVTLSEAVQELLSQNITVRYDRAHIESYKVREERWEVIKLMTIVM